MTFGIKKWQVVIGLRDDTYTFYFNETHSQNVIAIIGLMSFNSEIKSLRISEVLPVNPQIGGVVGQSGGQIFQGYNKDRDNPITEEQMRLHRNVK